MKFSIVMPTYKRPHVLPRAVASVLAQTHTDWQLIIVNNDAAPPIPLPDHPRIRVVQHAEKASASHARNSGLEYATGGAVTFLDDDDELTPDALATVAAAFAANPDATAVRWRMRYHVREYRHVETAVNATPTVALRREYATPSWRPEGCQDQRYFERVLSAAGGPVVDLPDVLVVVYQDPVGGLRAGRA